MESITKASTTVITMGIATVTERETTTEIATAITTGTEMAIEMATDTDSMVKGIVRDRAHHPRLPTTRTIRNRS